MTTPVMSDVHKRLRHFRLSKDLKQKQVADLLGVHISTYGKMELGEIGLDIPKAQKLAQFYSISIDELVGNVEENSSQLVSESRVDYNKKKRKPIRFHIEMDPDTEETELPKFLQKLQKLIEEENEGSK